MRVLDLPASAAAPRLSREFVADELALAGWPLNFVDVARLLIDELATNAVMHAVTDALQVTVDVCKSVLLVQVFDDDERLPQRRTASAADECGRGLDLVESLADDWGADRVDHIGKVVWFRLDRNGAG